MTEEEEYNAEWLAHYNIDIKKREITFVFDWPANQEYPANHEEIANRIIAVAEKCGYKHIR